MADYDEPISDTEKVGKVTLEVDLVTICLREREQVLLAILV